MKKTKDPKKSRTRMEKPEGGGLMFVDFQ